MGIFAVYARDFTSSIPVRKENLKANSTYTKQPDFNKPHIYHLYIKRDRLTGNGIEDIVSGQVIPPLQEKNGYYVFEITGNTHSSIGIIRFRSNLH